MVRKQHRLRALEVRVAGHDRVAGFDRPIEQDRLECVDPARRVSALPPDEQAQRGGNLVVPAPARVQLRAALARQLGDTAFDRGVDVFVGRRERERPFGELVLHPVERDDHHRGFLVGEDADAREHRDVGARARDVVGRQPPVEGQALRERHQLLGGSIREATVPQMAGSPARRGPPVAHAAPPCSRAHVSTERPHRRTKPAESSWRNVSAAS